jgi:secreted trypsin-like serine protease
MFGTAQSVLAVGLAATTWAGTIRHDVSDAFYLDRGAQPQFDAVGKLLIGGGYSSGVLITPNHVLTAAHLVDGSVVPADLSFEVGGEVLGATNIDVHPEWVNDATLGGDLAIVTLASAPTNVSPALRYEDPTEVGLTATFVGFGDSGNGLTGVTIVGTGEKRGGENVIDESGATFGIDDRILITDFDNPTSAVANFTGTPVALPLEYQAAPHDSGGGLFIQTVGVWRLVGITSFNSDIDQDECFTCYGEITGFSRVSQYNGWIDDVLCPADFDNDHVVGINDFLVVLAEWGDCGESCTADSDRDGMVGITDFLTVLADWGTCP